MSNMMIPQTTPATNVILKGDGLNVRDLHATKIVVEDNTFYFSVWKCPSLWQRILFLFSGTILFQCSSPHHPPVCLFVGNEAHE